jgi:hypothetical protein
MRHALFAGDIVKLTADLDAGEYMPHNQMPDGYGYDIRAYAGSYVNFERQEGELLVFTYNEMDAPWVDAEVQAKPSEFEHECHCADYEPEWFDDQESGVWED